MSEGEAEAITTEEVKEEEPSGEQTEEKNEKVEDGRLLKRGGDAQKTAPVSSKWQCAMEARVAQAND